MTGQSDGMAALLAGVMLVATFVFVCVLLGVGAAIASHVFDALS
jgi:hypothetical protein